jgi:prepilin-type N-terminal cleavage/methylation domain-containing protein
MIRKILRESMVRGRGFSLIEVLIAVALLAIFVVVLVGSLSTASKSFIINDTRQTAKNIAESQMEFIKRAPYAYTYNPPILADPSFSSSVTVSAFAGRGINIQKVSIVVSRNGNVAYTLEDFKGN